VGVSSRQQLAKQATACQAGLIGYDKHRYCLIPLDPLPTLASERSALRMFMCPPSKIGLVMVFSLDWQVIQVVALWNCHHLETTTIPATNCHQWYQPTVSTPSNRCHCASNWRSSIFTTHEFLLEYCSWLGLWC